MTNEETSYYIVCSYCGPRGNCKDTHTYAFRIESFETKELRGLCPNCLIKAFDQVLGPPKWTLPTEWGKEQTRIESPTER